MFTLISALMKEDQTNSIKPIKPIKSIKTIKSIPIIPIIPLKPVELCIEDVTNDSPTNSNSLESSISTYDSMMQTLNDELNDGNKENNNDTTTTTTLDLMQFEDIEDLDFFKMDCATAMSFDYEMNYTTKQLKHIAGYYGIKHKARKMEMIEDIVGYETDAANGDAVMRRKRLFHYMDTLKNDEYFKSFVMM